MLYDWKKLAIREERGWVMPRDRQEELGHIEARMQPEQWATMREKIQQWAADTGHERTDFFASNWKASGDWERVEGGVFQPLYSACCEVRPDPDTAFEYAGHMYGWLVRSVMIEVAETEDWVMYKNPEAGSPECPREFWERFIGGVIEWRGEYPEPDNRPWGWASSAA